MMKVFVQQLVHMPKRSKNITDEYTAFEIKLAQQVGVRLRERRKELGLTQEEVRFRMQDVGVYISRTQYSRAELGESLLNAAEVVALVQVLDVPERWLLRGDQ
jgi:hypothetical protein